MHHGSCDGLRSALMGIGRHDAVQVLNKALNRSTDSTLLVPKDVEALTNEVIKIATSKVITYI